MLTFQAGLTGCGGENSGRPRGGGGEGILALTAQVKLFLAIQLLGGCGLLPTACGLLDLPDPSLPSSRGTGDRAGPVPGSLLSSLGQVHFSLVKEKGTERGRGPEPGNPAQPGLSKCSSQERVTLSQSKVSS